MVNNENTLFNNFCETIEKHELLSATKRLIFCFSGGKDATIGLYFLRKYLEENKIEIKLHVIMVLFPKHVYFDANNEHVELDRVIEYWKSQGIHIDILQVSREDIDLSQSNPCKFCKEARKEKIDKYLSTNEYANDSSTLVTGYTLYDAIAYVSEICLRSDFLNKPITSNRIAACLHKMRPLEVLPSGMRLIRPLIRMDECLIKRFLEENMIPYVSQGCTASVQKHKRLYFEALKSLKGEITISYEGLIAFLNKNNIFLPETFENMNMSYGFTDC